MASEQPHRIINTRERGTSTDINRISQLSDRNSILAAWYLSANDTHESGVFTGLEVTVQGGTATITKGLALLDDGVASYPDSDYRWIELTANATGIALNTATPNRWITVEIAPNANPTITTSVDVFDPTTGAFVSASADKEVQSVPLITTVVSTVDFEFAQPTAGTLPLAYIFVDGANDVGSIRDNVVLCRPLLHSKAPLDIAESVYDVAAQRGNKALVQGGGASVTADGQVVQLEAVMGRFYEARHPFWIQRLSTVDLTSTRAWDAATKASTETNVYLYAVPPPYPTGYGTIAKQEFIPGTTAAGQFETFNTLGNENQVNCLVVASSTAPTLTGPQGAAVGATTINDTPFLQSAVAPTSNREEWVYLGAVDWATTEAKQQAFTVGQARVVPQSRWAYQSISAATGSPGGTISFDPRIGHSAAGDGGVTDGDGIIPPMVTDIHINVRMTSSMVGAWEFDITDSETTTAGLLTAGFSKEFLLVQRGGGSASVRTPMNIVALTPTITAVEDAGSSGSFHIIALSYIDPIIGSR